MSEEQVVQTETTETPQVEAPAEAPPEPVRPFSRREAIQQAVEKREAARPDKTGRLHGGDGKFVPKAEQVASVTTPVPPIPRKPMPKAWKQEYTPHWEKLDPELAGFLADMEDKREKDFLAGIEKYKNENNRYRQLFSPYEHAFNAQYGSVDRGIETLLKISDYASRDPNGFIQWFVQQRGINLNQGAQPQQEADPFQQALQSALQPWVQKVSGLEQQLQSFAQSKQREQEDQANRSVSQFLEDKDEKGEVKYSVPEAHLEDFAAHVQSVRGRHPDWDNRRVLEMAYENLVWTIPELRSARLEREAAEKKAKEAQERARQQAAAVQVKGAPSTSAATAPNPKDRRAVIRQAFDSLNS